MPREIRCRIIRRKGWNTPMSKCPCDVPEEKCPISKTLKNDLYHLDSKVNETRWWVRGLYAVILAAAIGIILST